MKRPRLWAGLYGLAFHAAGIAFVLALAAKSHANISTRFWAMTAPPLLVSAFGVYALFIGRYLPKRGTGKNVVLNDVIMGILAEMAIAASTSALYSLVAAGPALAAGRIGAYFVQAARNAFLAFLWVVGGFFTQVLVIGTLAGLVGWLISRKLVRSL